MHARVLGIAQDAGVPHIGCRCARCEFFRGRPLHPACLGLVGRRGWMIDATPAIGKQLRLLRAPLSGIALTHVHMGHIAGLLQLGPEALGVRGLRLIATPRVGEFLRSNAPWRLLVERGHLALHLHEPGTRVELEPGLEIESVKVPHRDEYADTVAYFVHGPKRTLLYLPDIDRWTIDLPALLARCDLALLDGTFWARDEIAHQGEVPHPAVEETLDLLSPEEAAKVRFIHLNHTNRLLDPDGPRALVAVQGGRIPLG